MNEANVQTKICFPTVSSTLVAERDSQLSIHLPKITINALISRLIWFDPKKKVPAWAYYTWRVCILVASWVPLLSWVRRLKKIGEKSGEPEVLPHVITSHPLILLSVPPSRISVLFSQSCLLFFIQPSPPPVETKCISLYVIRPGYPPLEKSCESKSEERRGYCLPMASASRSRSLGPSPETDPSHTPHCEAICVAWRAFASRAVQFAVSSNGCRRYAAHLLLVGSPPRLWRGMLFLALVFSFFWLGLQLNSMVRTIFYLFWMGIYLFYFTRLFIFELKKQISGENTLTVTFSGVVCDIYANIFRLLHCLDLNSDFLSIHP